MTTPITEHADTDSIAAGAVGPDEVGTAADDAGVLGAAVGVSPPVACHGCVHEATSGTTSNTSNRRSLTTPPIMPYARQHP
jgi:hypothetical protein